MLPNGSVPKRLVDHWFRNYKGRFEKNIKFVATLFNLRQRHNTIRKAARVGTTHPRTLVKLAHLANNSAFRDIYAGQKPIVKRRNQSV
ncbi:hypothetical protein JG688_00016274 [Phytophthora aleatoria]|uniref:Uncharacterized protein n=1 Tax=Phytophthora aleatoria TaxID=2496075 RepID=A0A8J5I8N8_9STRA|nr:hypothetical protein JG688_00016274 [Phytophthora aleatoria]